MYVDTHINVVCFSGEFDGLWRCWVVGSIHRYHGDAADVARSRCLTRPSVGALYRIWCGVNILGDTSAFVIPAGQLLLTRRGKTRLYTVGIVFEFYTVPL